MLWSDNTRQDGVMVVEQSDHTWVIWPSDQRPQIMTCSCCGSIFHTPTQAKRAADVVYPIV